MFGGMGTGRGPRGLTDEARAAWDGLAAPTRTPDEFDAAMISTLPEPVRRWLRQAIAAGTPLRSSVDLRMHGQIRLGGWRRFRARQRLSPGGGFVWAATAWLSGLPVTGFDRLAAGVGEMRWRLVGALPVLSATGVDVTRSAEGRHAGELLLAVPAAALDPGVTWDEVDGSQVIAHIPERGGVHDVTLAIAQNGMLTAVSLRRWGNPGREPFGWHTFGAICEDQVTVDGMSIPRTITAGWHYGTDRWPEGQFIRYTIDDLQFR